MILKTEDNAWAFNVPVGTVLKVNEVDGHYKYYSTFTVLEKIESKAFNDIIQMVAEASSLPISIQEETTIKDVRYKIRLTHPGGSTSIYEDCTPGTLITWCVPHIISKVFLDSDWYQ